jgi:predicted dehydrogenase
MNRALSNKILLAGTMVLMIGCNQPASKTEKDDQMVHLITLDPGHFHAALVQKTMYENVDPVVHVYAPAGNDLQLHLDRINAYNNRKENPTHWKEEVYSSNDFFEKMIKEKKGNVVVLSGNNQKKSEYILQSLQNGFNVLADKPMAIDSKGFEQLKQAFDVAAKNNLLLYDIMTERYEMTTILQRELSMIPEIFGTLEKGTADNPAVVMESEHCFYKYISGNVLTRPAWFMDVSQQGEGIVDVSTHLVDLVQWECFPDQAIDYTKDIQVDSAKHGVTRISNDEFKAITKWHNDPHEYPDYLAMYSRLDGSLDIFSNGSINYRIRGINTKVKVQWDYTNAAQTDTHYSMLRGTKANLIIRQGTEEQYKPILYIEPVESNKTFNPAEAFKNIQSKYPGTDLKKTNKGWEVVIPDKYKEGHEEHFARVTNHFLEYLKNKNMPAWEIPNMLTKYYITTKALELASKNK